MTRTSPVGGPTLRRGRPDPASAWRRRPVRPGQLVAGEIAVLAMITSYSGPLWLFGGISAASVATVLAAFGRSGDRWWCQAVAHRRRYLRRRRRAAAAVLTATAPGQPDAPGPVAQRWLPALIPGVRLGARSVRDMHVGIGADEAGWFAAVQVGVDTGLAGRFQTDLPLDALARLVQRPSGGEPRAASTVQVVWHTIAGPDASLDAGSGPARSYAQLAGADEVFAHQAAWIAVRIGPADALERAARGGVAAIEAAVGAAALRAVKVLREHGVSAQVLDQSGLAAALVEATSLDGPPQESWANWTSGTLAHACYAVVAWPQQLQAARLAALSQAVGTMAVAFTATPGPVGDRRRVGGLAGQAHPAPTPSTVHRSAVVRIAAQPQILDRLGRELADRAASVGLRLRRLDGEQAPGAYACAPAGIALPAATYPTAAARPAGGPAGSTVAGLILGRDSAGAAVPVRVFRPRPSRLVLVGTAWLARLVAFRALGVGARVVVRSAEPRRWGGWASAVTGASGVDRHRLVSADEEVTQAGYPHAPVLYVDDLGEERGPSGRRLGAPPLGPWQTRLTVLPRLAGIAPGMVAGADAALLQRLAPDEVAAAVSLWHLSDETTRLVQVLHDDMFAVLGGGADRYVWAAPTSLEHDLFGAPPRGV